MKWESNWVYLLVVGSWCVRRPEIAKTKLNKPKEENLPEIRILSSIARLIETVECRLCAGCTPAHDTHAHCQRQHHINNIQMIRGKNRWQWHIYVFSWKSMPGVRSNSIYLLRTPINVCTGRSPVRRYSIVFHVQGNPFFGVSICCMPPPFALAWHQMSARTT